MSERARQAALVAVGDELVRGERRDANLPWLARRLERLGWRVVRAELAGDDEERLAATLDECLARHGLVVTTGGLGPTLDDVTRDAAARALGVPLEHDEEAWESIRAWWSGRGLEAPRSNARQARLPAGAERLPNAHGTAPGFLARRGEAWLAALPGPPREMQGVFEDALEARLAEVVPPGPARSRRELFLFGLSESLFAERAGAWMDRRANPRMGVLAGGGVLTLSIEAEAATPAEAQALADARAAEVRARFAAYLYSEEEPDLARVVGALLLERGLTVATAESCTGGLVAARLTDVPGISAAFREGFVTYSDEAKARTLGVPTETLERQGAVSRETALAMADGARERAGADLAVALTGIAGPGGGTPEKPVGLVWLAVAGLGAPEALERRFPARGRGWVRRWAAATALDLLRRRILGLPLEPSP